jgi:hypothetical protein
LRARMVELGTGISMGLSFGGATSGKVILPITPFKQARSCHSG